MKRKFINHLLAAFIMAGSVCAVEGSTLVQTYGDAGVVMGSLDDNDQDGYSAVSMGHSSPALPYISTMQTAGHAGVRRAIAEFSLSDIRSADSLESSVLSFYFDDSIFPDYSANGAITQNFTLEAYVVSADGVISGSDSDDADAAVSGSGLDDWTSEVIASWTFVAGYEGPYTFGNDIVGIYGPEDLYPANYGDDQFNLYGMIGFEVDVTSVIESLMANSEIEYIGFRWVANDEDGHWTSMDPAGYLPTLTSIVVPEPASIALVLGGSLSFLRRRK